MQSSWQVVLRPPLSGASLRCSPAHLQGHCAQGQGVSQLHSVGDSRAEDHGPHVPQRGSHLGGEADQVILQGTAALGETVGRVVAHSEKRARACGQQRSSENPYLCHQRGLTAIGQLVCIITGPGPVGRCAAGWAPLAARPARKLQCLSACPHCSWLCSSVLLTGSA